MIKAIVLDIDGVIVGNKEGINFPQPSKKVSAILRKIHDSGIPVSFLTGKPTFAAWKNIAKIGIDNPHIADGGAVIFNPIQKKIIKQTVLDQNDLKQLLGMLGDKVYVNFFTTENYYLKESLVNDYTKIYGKFMGKPPVLVPDLNKLVEELEFSKINISAFNKDQKSRVDSVLENLSDRFNFSWSSGPNTGNVDTAVVTPKNASKKLGVKYLADYLKVDLKNVLGVGDTIHDWDFIEICGYKGVMGNATEELKLKFDFNREKEVLGGHVNDDGIIDVFKHFNLL